MRKKYFLQLGRITRLVCDEHFELTGYGDTNKHVMLGQINGATKVVVLIDGILGTVYTSDFVEQVKEEVVSHLFDVSTKDVLVILYTDDLRYYINVKNLIVVTDRTGKMRVHALDKCFYGIKNTIKNEVKETKRYYAHADSRFGADLHGGSHMTFVVWGMIFALLYSFFKVTKGSTDTFGISGYYVLTLEDLKRLVTYMFAHASISHLFGNCVALMLIGSFYTKKRGFLNFLIIFIWGGINAGIVSVLYQAINGDYNTTTVGASGAIMAVLGACVVNAFMDQASINKKGIVIYAIVTIVLSGLGYRVDNACHIGGFISGMLIEFSLATISELISGYKFYLTRAKY